jgi:hypothetical protein
LRFVAVATPYVDDALSMVVDADGATARIAHQLGTQRIGDPGEVGVKYAVEIRPAVRVVSRHRVPYCRKSLASRALGRGRRIAMAFSLERIST